MDVYVSTLSLYILPSLQPMNAVTLQRCNNCTHDLLFVGCANADRFSWPSKETTKFPEAIGVAVGSREVYS